MSLGDTNAPSWDVEVEKLGAWDLEANRGLLFVGTDTLLLLLLLLLPYSMYQPTMDPSN